MIESENHFDSIDLAAEGDKHPKGNLLVNKVSEIKDLVAVG